jgi:hypothetical protein
MLTFLIIVLQTLIEMDSTQKRFVTPDNPGAYFEFRCKNTSCPNSNKLCYAFIGCNLSFDYFQEFLNIRCLNCDSEAIRVVNVGFFRCKWTWKGEIDTGIMINGQTSAGIGYEICLEIKNKRWKWLMFKVEEISTEEVDRLRKRINKAFDFDADTQLLQAETIDSRQRFSENNEATLKTEVERKRDIIYCLKKNLKEQQKVIKRLTNESKSFEDSNLAVIHTSE